MIKIKLKNRSYGFEYSEEIPFGHFTEIKIPVALERVATTSEFWELANNHCACVCTMNISLIMRRHHIGDINKCRLGNDRTELFKSIHRIVGNGPVIFYKPKLNRFLKKKGSKIRAVPITDIKDIEESLKKRIPVAMLVNAGITHWHWIVVIGIRKYVDGRIYLNILDGWNKRIDRYLRFNGRETFIRALRPTMIN